MQKDADPWQAASYLGMSPEVLLNTYGHHHPGYLSDAVEKNAVRGPANERKAHVSGAVIPLWRKSVFAFAALKLRRTRFALRTQRGCATRSPKGEAWWVRQRSYQEFFQRNVRVLARC
jgi:hypothetical protein